MGPHVGCRGHFLTKSRLYSTTFTAIKNERRTHQLTQLLDELGHHDTPVLVINHWQLTGAGHRNDAERELAHAIAERTARYRSTERSWT
jgi:hypothetical protein